MFACYVSAEENYIPLSRVSIAGDFDDLYAPGVTMELSYYENEEIDIEKSVISWYTCSSENAFTLAENIMKNYNSLDVDSQSFCYDVLYQFAKRPLSNELKNYINNSAEK